MKKTPSRFLYAAAGWLIGGYIGVATMAVATFAGGLMGVAPLGIGTYLSLVLMGSMIGASLGWNKAAREQSQNAMILEQAAPRTQAPAQSQELTPQVHRSFADKLTPKLRDGSYAEAISAEKAEASPAQAAR